MKKFIGVLILICLVFMACSDDDEDTEPSKLAIIDIKNASTLFIAPASNGRGVGRAAGDTKLFKITQDGYIREVPYIDENGKEMIYHESPIGIYNAGNDYVIVKFLYDDSYLTRKSDGAVFILPTDGIPTDYLQTSNFKNAEKIQTDKNANLYFETYDTRGGSFGFVKIDVTNPDKIIKTNYLPYGDTTNSFAVNPEGHIIYKIINENLIRIKKSNGGLHNISNYSNDVFYIDLNGNIRFIRKYREAHSLGEDYPTIEVYIIDSEFNLKSTEVVFSIPSNEWNFYNNLISFQSYLLYIKTKVFILGSASICEIEGDNPRISNLPINITHAEKSDSYIYVNGILKDNNAPALMRIDPVTFDIQNVLSNDYDVKHFIVSKDDNISFTAVSMANGAKVIGNISPTLEVSILSSEIDIEDVVLERIQ